MRVMLATAGLLAALLVAACGDDAGERAGEPASTAGRAAQPTDEHEVGEKSSREQREDRGASGGGEATGTEIVTAESQYGKILFDSDERAIYLFDKEGASTSECYGECAAAWPPVLSAGEPRAGDGVDARLLGTTERDDGSAQVTYAGRPLYYYVDDPVGEVLCHNVFEFGGLWLVIEPDGDAVA